MTPNKPIPRSRAESIDEGASTCVSEEALANLWEGQLGEAEAERLHQHVDQCESCFALFAALASTADMLDPSSGQSSAPNSEVEEGKLFAGRYKIERVIGKGGMGVVFAATDTQLCRSVALKLLPLSAVADKVARARLEREAHAVATLDHPGIIRIHDVGKTDHHRTFLVMELVSGQSLKERLRVGRMPATVALRILIDVARTLSVAHRARVVHRDIKPDNIMIRDNGRPVLLDFGIAKNLKPRDSAASMSTLTVKGSLVGTPIYMAPEQAERIAVDTRADQFSLAVVAYEMLTGRVPWRGGNVTAILTQVLRDTPPSPSSLQPCLPTSLDPVVARAMAKAPDFRYPDMDAFADALTAVLDQMELDQADTLDSSGEPPLPQPEESALPAVRGTTTGKQRTRPRWRTIAVVSIAVLLVAAGVLTARRLLHTATTSRSEVVIADLGAGTGQRNHG